MAPVLIPGLMYAEGWVKEGDEALQTLVLQ